MNFWNRETEPFVQSGSVKDTAIVRKGGYYVHKEQVQGCFSGHYLYQSLETNVFQQKNAQVFKYVVNKTSALVNTAELGLHQAAWMNLNNIFLRGKNSCVRKITMWPLLHKILWKIRWYLIEGDITHAVRVIKAHRAMIRSIFRAGLIPGGRGEGRPWSGKWGGASTKYPTFFFN